MFGFGKNRRISEISSGIVANFGDGIVAVDAEHNVILYNDGARRIFGFAPDEVLGHHVNMLLPERFRVQHDGLVGVFSSFAKEELPFQESGRPLSGLRKDGSEFAISVTVVRAGPGTLSAVIRDISEDKKTEDELIRLATTDPLTGALNRREFTTLADQEAQRAGRYNHALSIMMLDLDHFKHINDTYGHAAGDKALQRFTTLCINALRNVDIFGRWGGEEFVALLPETAVADGAVIAERLRKIVSQSTITSGEHKITITVSIGIAQYRAGEITIEGPLSRADAAVYEAKKAGRNQVSIVQD